MSSAIGAWCAERGLPLIEDCAQAHGARRGGRIAGAFGALGCFSFYPTKNLGALGDAGAVVTSDDALAARLRALRQYGWRAKYDASVPGGVNSRLDEMQAAVLSLRLADARRAATRAGARSRRAMPAACAIRTSCWRRPSGEDHVAHLVVLRTKARASLQRHLRRVRRSPPTSTTPFPITCSPRTRDRRAASLPVTERLCARGPDAALLSRARRRRGRRRDRGLQCLAPRLTSFCDPAPAPRRHLVPRARWLLGRRAGLSQPRVAARAPRRSSRRSTATSAAASRRCSSSTAARTIRSPGCASTCPRRRLRSTFIELARNFGSFAAIRAGMTHARGPHFAVMAADLQDPPELVRRLLRGAGPGRGRRRDRRARRAATTRGRRGLPPASSGAPTAGSCSRRSPSAASTSSAATSCSATTLVALDELNSSLVGPRLLARRSGARACPTSGARGRTARARWSWRRKLRYLADSMLLVLGPADPPALDPGRARDGGRASCSASPCSSPASPAAFPCPATPRPCW